MIGGYAFKIPTTYSDVSNRKEEVIEGSVHVGQFSIEGEVSIEGGLFMSTSFQ